jgi:uncharacterized protein YdhG (YjbR/CyaY superfamily)
MPHPFDAYLAGQPEPQRATLETVAATLRLLLPSAEECMSYGMPAFKVDGIALAGIAGFVKHCSYFPHSGASLEGIAADLQGYDWDKGTLRFPIDKPLPRALLRKLIAERLRVESSRPRTGKAREFYANGVLKAEGAMRDGELHGAWSWYRADGSLMRTGQFRAGAQAGIWRTFDREGVLVKETRV